VFNAGIRPPFNPAVNIHGRRVTLEEHAALHRIHHAQYGVIAEGKSPEKT
jgi:hypothetical protein